MRRENPLKNMNEETPGQVQQSHPDILPENEIGVTRRGFNKWLGVASAAAAVGALAAYWARQNAALPVKIVAQAGDIPVGGSKIFTYPADDRPCFLLRPAEDTYLAFSRLCTHHTCPVFYRPQENVFACPLPWRNVFSHNWRSPRWPPAEAAAHGALRAPRRADRRRRLCEILNRPRLASTNRRKAKNLQKSRR
jgi:hypothetical protein